MLEAMAHFAIEPFTALFALGKAPGPNDRPRPAQAHILKTKDDRMLVIHLSSIDKFWDEVTETFDAPHLRIDLRFASRLARIENYDALNATLNAFTRTRAEWVAIMDQRDVPFAAVNSIEDAIDDPQIRALNLIVPLVRDGVDAADRTIRTPIKMDGVRQTVVRPAPRLNADGATIRAALLAKKAWPELASISVE